MKKFLFLVFLFTGVSNSLLAQFYFTIVAGGQTNINGGTGYTVTGTNPKVITATAAVNIDPSIISYYLDLGTSVTLVSASGYSITMNLNVNPTSSATLIFESQGTASSYIVFGSGSSITSTGQPLNVAINMRTQSTSQTARVNIQDLQLTTNGGSFSTNNVISYNTATPALRLDGAVINTSSGNISLFGDSYGGSSYSYAGVLMNNAQLNTTTGNINITGILRTSTTTARAINISGTSTIQSTSGNITIDGSIPATSTANPTYITEISCSGNISSAGDILIKGDLLGTSTTTDGVLCNTVINTVGNLTFSGTEIHIGNHLTVTGLNKTLNIIATRDFGSLNTNGRLLFTTNNGDIIIQGDSDATGGGLLELDYLTFNPGNGSTILKTTSVSWLTSSESVKPYINGTGDFTFEPSGTSFSGAAQTVWFVFDQDANGIGNFRLGKVNNATDLLINNVGGLTINGSIQIYGTIITLNSNITTTNTSIGDIILEGSSVTGAGTITVATGRTLTMNVWTNFTYTNAINGTNVNFVKGWIGNLVLSAACGYTGSTTINNGTIQFNQNKIFNDINIVSGKSLILGPGKQFEINGACVNDGTLKLSSGSTLLTGSSSLFSGAGNYVVEQTITGAGSTTPTGRFWYLGSPVSNAFSTTFNAGGPNVLKFRDEPNNQWQEITNDGVVLVPGRGYYCQLTANSTLGFSGSSINNGPMTISNLSRTTGINYEGFNLVANPYPSYLDWDAVTKTNVGNTMWYRTATGNTAASMVFETYVAGAAGGIGTNLSGNVATKLIPPMQAFWVRVDQGQTTGSLTLDNTMRSHFTSVGGSTAGLRSTNDELKAFLRMNLLNNAAKDQLIVYMNGAATNSFDALDGEKMMQAGIPQFYTKAADKKIVINGLNSAKKQQSLPITMEIPSTGVHTFEIENLEIESGLVWLEDKQEETMQTLEEGFTYQFYAEAGINTERFVLHFNLLDNNTPSAPNFNEVGSAAYFNGKGANVHAEAAGVVVIKLPASTEGATDIQIRDAAGKLVYTGSTSNLQTSVQLAQANGIYYVTLSSNNGVEVRKVFVQQ